MKLWSILFIAMPLLGSAYVFWRIWHILPFAPPFKTGVMAMLVLVFGTLYIHFGGFIDKLPMPLATAIYHTGTSWLIILLYLFMTFAVLDIGRLLHIVSPSFMRNSTVGSLSVLIFLTAIFVYGYFNYMHKQKVVIDMKTEKRIEQPLTIVMISDLHLGYHNRNNELARWVKLINAEKPDIILVAGDIIDGSMRPLIVEKMAETFSKLQAPVYACLGNHEYYSGHAEALQFYRDAGINLLTDSAVTVKGMNIVGRDDRTNQRRKSIDQLVNGLDKSRYTILLDHQPYHLEKAQQAGIDFQLSGHTHYGQVWPISWIEDRIYENAYGPLQKGNTQYFVTSGIGIWGAKFRIGTRSEYLVAHLTTAR